MAEKEANIIVIDKIEEAQDDKGKTYLKITDKAGVTRNFKEGRSKLLTNKGHLLQEGVAIRLYFEDYKAPGGQVFPFVKDFEVIKQIFEQEATEKIQAQQSDTRDKSVMLSYAKDLAIADKIEAKDILFKAQYFYEWLTGKIQVNWITKELITEMEVKVETKTSKTVEEAPGNKEISDNEARQVALGEVEDKQPRYTKELGLELQQIDFKQDAVKHFLETVMGITLRKSAKEMIDSLNDKQYQIFMKEVESRK